MPSESQATDPSRCEAMNARGERCGKRAARGRFCLVHAGRQDMKELGRRGGQVRPNTKLRKAADDDLREQAREVLAKSLRGEKVDKEQLAAARSLFSYRADSPPVQAPSSSASSGKTVGLIDVTMVAAEARLYSSAGVDPAAEAAFLEAMRARQPVGDADDARHITRTRTTTPSPKVSSEPASRGSSPSATNNDFDPLAVSDEAPFNEEAKLERRYGSEVEGSTWRWA